jgi:hypothetical protein
MRSYLPFVILAAIIGFVVLGAMTGWKEAAVCKNSPAIGFVIKITGC